jgi:acid phosphatase (class A)
MLGASALLMAGLAQAEVAAPDCTSKPMQQVGYLQPGAVPDVTRWIPPAPDALSVAQLLDDKTIDSTRPLLSTPRGKAAAEDDVYEPSQLLARFAPSLAPARLDAEVEQRVAAIVGKLEIDASRLIEPVKHKVCAGGRVRPFVARAGMPTCLSPVDIAGRAKNDLLIFRLAESGSYPSTHAMIGLLTGMVLAELFPERSAELLARGVDFGQSRVVCGFHYPSFRDDMDAARAQLATRSGAAR